MALDFFAGCVGGCAGILVGHPLDTIKVHLQTQDFRNPIYRGTFHCFQTILKKESMGGLYRGMSSPMAGVAVINAIVFGVYGNTQRRMSDPDSFSSHFLAGFTAGLAQSFVCSPMELAKTRLQIQRGVVYRSCLHCIVQIARTEGLRGVFRGLGVTMIRDAPGMGVYFLSYEMLSRTLSQAEPLSTAQVMLAGGLAGSISWVSTFPLDVLKSRLQVDGMYGPAKYSGAVDCVRQSLRSEGPAFLVRGLSSTLIRAFPVNAATFAGVTWVFRLAGVGAPDKDSGYHLASDREERSGVRLYHSEDARGLKGAELWENWENKALKGLFHWRRVMMHSMEGSFFADHQRKGLVNARLLQPELKSADGISESLELEDRNCENNGLGGDSEHSAQYNEDPQSEVIPLIPLEAEGDVGILKEKYRTSAHENG